MKNKDVISRAADNPLLLHSMLNPINRFI